MDAVRRLAERAKIPLEFDNNPAEQQSRHLKDQLLEIHEKITQRWQNCLLNEAAGQMARDYLAKRGVSAEAIKLFRLGAAPELWDDTVNWAKSKNHELPLVEKAGLIIRKEETGNFYDRFRGLIDVFRFVTNGQGDWFQRTHFVRRRKSCEVCQLAGDADFHQGKSIFRP